MRDGEGVLFWALALLYLVPVWAYPYVPTQDGPSHLDNAQILKALCTSAAGYETYFEVRANPVPNWTSYLLLAGMLYVVPPPIAEAVIVSLANTSSGAPLRGRAARSASEGRRAACRRSLACAF